MFFLDGNLIGITKSGSGFSQMNTPLIHLKINAKLIQHFIMPRLTMPDEGKALQLHGQQSSNHLKESPPFHQSVEINYSSYLATLHVQIEPYANT